MSVFRGSISEYPGIIVDHFISANCDRGRIFFLSHCHKDHMTGLSSPNIISALQRLHTHLLCSDVTRSLLLNDPEFTHLAPYLRGLPTEEPIVMSLETTNTYEKLNVTVTLLPAGHCPGSSMFFFQGIRGNVLYTGDFRLTLEEAKRLKPLHCDGSLLDVSTLYVDTTFFHPVATNIPSRDTSRDLILQLVEEWLAKSPKSVVHLQCAMFGYEHLYMGVLKRFKTKIHTAPWKINAYRAMTAVTDCLTTDGESTRIHACTFRMKPNGKVRIDYLTKIIPLNTALVRRIVFSLQKGQKGRPGLPCGSCQTEEGPPNVLRVKPSTQWFLLSKESTTHPCVFVPQFNMYRVIHSMHASYSELCDFITYIKPRRIVPCVIPSCDTSLTDVCARLKRLLPQTEVSSTVCSDVQQKSKKDARILINKKLAEDEAESDDSRSTGDESIDEFTNTEEKNSVEEKPAFSHPQRHDTHLSLPSLLSTEDTNTSPPPSSESVTLGSLKQSPIDLSLTPSRDGSSQSVNETISSASSPGDNNADKVVAKSTDLLHEEDIKGDCTPKQPAAAAESTKDWCLKYECSQTDSFQVNTPPAKRVRRLKESKPPLRRLFKTELSTDTAEQKVDHGSSCTIDLTQDEQTAAETTDSMLVRNTPPMIDLTQDDTLPEFNYKNTTKAVKYVPQLCTTMAGSVHEVHQKDRTIVPPVVDMHVSDRQSVDGLSDSQRSASQDSSSGHDPFGSPNYLPPTPGRENICSILQRPKFP